MIVSSLNALLNNAPCGLFTATIQAWLMAANIKIKEIPIAKFILMLAKSITNPST
jgi:hypothetical protein